MKQKMSQPKQEFWCPYILKALHEEGGGQV